MKAKNKNSSVERWRLLLDAAKIQYTVTVTGNEIVFLGPKNEAIQVNHNGSRHWTIRIPGTAKDGMRFSFDADINIDTVAHLIIINDILAIRYK